MRIAGDSYYRVRGGVSRLLRADAAPVTEIAMGGLVTRATALLLPRAEAISIRLVVSPDAYY